MTPEASEPDRMLAMAYVDGELDTHARAHFEQRLAREPALAHEVAALERLALLAELAAPAEPAELEWQRVAALPSQRALVFGAWTLLALGAAGAAGALVWLVLLSDLALGLRAALGALAAGAALLLIAAARARLRTRRFDAYTAVKR